MVMSMCDKSINNFFINWVANSKPLKQSQDVFFYLFLFVLFVLLFFILFIYFYLFYC